MDIILGFIVCFSLIHIVIGLTTNYSTFYWIGKILIDVEAIQNGMIHSIPIWMESWKRNYVRERSELKGLVKL
jgi:hypothetical protein